MKKLIPMNNYRLLSICLLSMWVLVSSCKKDEKKNEVNFSNIAITGANEVPANTSSATGVLNAIYDKDAKTLRYSITFTGLNPINAHFHKGAAGTSGPPVIDLKPASGIITSPIAGTSRVFTSAEETDLLAGNWYVNIHSNDYAAGEIRAQLIAN
jgi:hypothetical protein